MKACSGRARGRAGRGSVMWRARACRGEAAGSLQAVELGAAQQRQRQLEPHGCGRMPAAGAHLLRHVHLAQRLHALLACRLQVGREGQEPSSESERGGFGSECCSERCSEQRPAAGFLPRVRSGRPRAGHSPASSAASSCARCLRRSTWPARPCAARGWPPTPPRGCRWPPGWAP